MIDQQFWRGRRVLVTGHTGFKGSWLMLWLHALGAEVSGFASPPPTTPSLYGLARLEEIAPSSTGDVRDLAAVEKAVAAAAPEVVFHLAAQALVNRSLTDPVERRREGSRIAAYGAPAKGNTLLNYCGVGTDFIEYTCDLNPHKQGHYLPGTHIPIRPPDAIRETQPDLIFILPWNLSEEIMEQLAFIRDWGGGFILRTPDVRVAR